MQCFAKPPAGLRPDAGRHRISVGYSDGGTSKAIDVHQGSVSWDALAFGNMNEQEGPRGDQPLRAREAAEVYGGQPARFEGDGNADFAGSFVRGCSQLRAASWSSRLMRSASSLFGRAIPHGPATHPITAILFIVGGMAIASMRALKTPRVAVVALLMVALVGAARIVEAAFGLTILQIAQPFAATLAREASEGTPIATGWNSAAMFVLVSLAFLLRYLKRPRTAQIVAALGMAAPLVSLTGYIYGVTEFYGQMSLTTSVIGIIYSVSPLSPQRADRDHAGHMQPLGRGQVRAPADRRDHLRALLRRFLIQQDRGPPEEAS